MSKNPIEFWLKDNRNIYRQLPVNPESVEVESPFGINTINIDSLGEVGIIGERGLKRISIESFFPAQYNPTYCETTTMYKPDRWVELLENWRNRRRNIRLIVGGTSLSIPVYIENFNYERERNGHIGDIFYTMDLVEYKPLVVRTIVTTNTKKKTQAKSQNAQSERGTSGAKDKAKTHVISKSSTLANISKKYYGTTAKWQNIYNANKAVIGKDPLKLPVGKRIVIP